MHAWIARHAAGAPLDGPAQRCAQAVLAARMPRSHATASRLPLDIRASSALQRVRGARAEAARPGAGAAFATLAYHPEGDLLDRLAHHAASIVRTFRPQATSNSLWAFAKLAYVPCQPFLLTSASQARRPLPAARLWFC